MVNVMSSQADGYEQEGFSKCMYLHHQVYSCQDVNGVHRLSKFC